MSVPKNLIVFAKDPSAGRAKTRIGREAGNFAAAALYEELVELTARTVEAWGGSATWWTDGGHERLSQLAGPDARFTPQPPGTLGERMAGAFKHTFARHGGYAAVIGTDCPELTAAHIDALFTELESGADGAVLPATDGGYIALALSAEFGGAFENVRWSSHHTLSDTLARFEHAGKRVAVLPPLPDVDEVEDLRGLYRRAQADARLAPIRKLLEHYHLAPGFADGVVDDLGRPVPFNAPARRIVSLIPSVTECLFDMGVGNAVAGRTDFCAEPADRVCTVPAVGGPKTVDVEQVLALVPDLVLADAEENDREQVRALIDAGVRVFVALPRTVGDVAAYLRRVGRLVGAAEAGEAGALELEALPPLPGPPTPAVCLVWKEPLIAATDATLPGALMAAGGFECLHKTRGGPRYPETTPGYIRALGPEVLLLPSDPYPFTMEEGEALASAIAGNHSDISTDHPSAPRYAAPLALPFQGEWITWYGMRTAARIEKLRKLREEILAAG